MLTYASLITPLIGIIISCIGIFYIIANHKISRDQTFRDLFREFNKRFDELNESLNEIVDGYSDSRIENKIIQDYLNLCSEEYLWWKKGRIEEIAWQACQAGIIDYTVKCPKIKNYFIDEYQRGYNKSYYGFLNYIIKYIANK